MSEPTEPTPVTPPAPPTGEAAAPPPPPTTTWSTAAPVDPPAEPYAEAAAPAPTIGRNLAIGIAMAALVIGGLIGAIAANVLHDDGGRTTTGFGSGRSGQVPPGLQGNGQNGQNDPRGVDPDGDDWQGGQVPGGRGRLDPRGVDPDGDDRQGGGQVPGGQGTTPSTPTTATTAPAVAGT